MLNQPRVPLAEIPDDVLARLSELGGGPNNLYRCLANQPAMLRAWVEMAWRIRNDASTPRRLRELVILRCAQLYGSEYEWTHHVRMGLAAGITQAEIDAMAGWRRSEAFSEIERAALAYAEAVFDGDVTAEAWGGLARHLDPGEMVEVTLTAAFYTAVPRALEAMQVPLED